MEEFSDRESKVTPKQWKAIESLAFGETRAKAAEAAGISERLLYKWLHIPAFRMALSKQRDLVLAISSSRLMGKADLAIDKLSEAAEGEMITPDQIRASNYLLSLGKGYAELAHFGERLDYLSNQIEELKKQAGAERPGVLELPEGLENGDESDDLGS